MPEPTLLVLDTDPSPRLGRLTGRVRIRYTDEAGLAGQLPHADALLVWDFTSDAVRAAWPGDGPRPAGCIRRAQAWTGCSARSWPRPTPC